METTAREKPPVIRRSRVWKTRILHLGGRDDIEDKPANEQNRRDRFRKTELSFA